MGEPTEEPTPRRLRRAREQGDAGASGFAAQSVAFVVAVALLAPAARAAGERITERLRGAIAHAADRAPTAAIDATAVAKDLVALVGPIVAAVAATAAVATAVQTGGFVSVRALAPRLDRVDPLAGARRLASPMRLFAVARALVAAAVVAALAAAVLRAHLGDLARLGGRLAWVDVALARLVSALAWDAALAGLAIGAVDLLVVRRAWRRRLRMTRDELRRELRESEGDPALRRAREQAHHEAMTAASIGNVRGAAVLVTGDDRACALRYDAAAGDEAPVLVARGRGDLAASLVRAAHDWGVPAVHAPALASALDDAEIDAPIAEALYDAAAAALRDAGGEST